MNGQAQGLQMIRVLRMRASLALCSPSLRNPCSGESEPPLVFPQTPFVVARYYDRGGTLRRSLINAATRRYYASVQERFGLTADEKDAVPV